MKFLFPVVVFSVSLLTISFSTYTDKKKMYKEQNGFALIELFTSEGCSSCPPADAIVEEVQKQYDDKNVLILGYHVDYWDKLGWKDIFSNSLFTERQEYYSNIFRLNSIYTPQIVVNGKTEFLGSDKNKLINNIETQLNEEPAESIKLNADQNSDGKIDVKYSVENSNLKEEQFVVILVQKMATNKINRGENEGRTLHHINIVRKLAYTSTKETSTTFDIPTGSKKDDLFVACFIQNRSTGKIKAIRSSSID